MQHSAAKLGERPQNETSASLPEGSGVGAIQCHQFLRAPAVLGSGHAGLRPCRALPDAFRNRSSAQICLHMQTRKRGDCNTLGPCSGARSLLQLLVAARTLHPHSIRWFPVAPVPLRGDSVVTCIPGQPSRVQKVSRRVGSIQQRRAWCLLHADGTGGPGAIPLLNTEILVVTWHFSKAASHLWWQEVTRSGSGVPQSRFCSLAMPGRAAGEGRAGGGG